MPSTTPAGWRTAIARLPVNWRWKSRKAASRSAALISVAAVMTELWVRLPATVFAPMSRRAAGADNQRFDAGLIRGVPGMPF